MGELGVFEVLDGGEVLVDQRRRWSAARGVRRAAVRASTAVGRADGRARARAACRLVCQPARSSTSTICLVGTGPDLAGELGQFDFKDGNADGGGQMEERATRGGMDEADEIAPGEAVLHDGDRALPDRRPDPAQQRLEADAMLVGRPQFDLARAGSAVATASPAA